MRYFATTVSGTAYSNEVAIPAPLPRGSVTPGAGGDGEWVTIGGSSSTTGGKKNPATGRG